MLLYCILFVYIFLMIILVYITILSKRLKNLKDSFYLQKLIEEKNLVNKQKICLFISFNNKDNLKIINDITGMSENYEIFLFYKGPEWQKNSISKKINSNIKIILDEKGFIGKYFNINEYPSWVIVDETLLIKQKGKYLYEE
ncbi:hypothetical protein U1P98_10870 [Lysinibacillus irui]|uniref:Uncharacterized protein n=1 Tax=Lysinibacillus irui TaxID=2998077 RepID=A0ABU5NL76_9BACI|nr:hypothetical protein [Lysinibacillus irui]MEA0555082.1 hypothetical protein [Lysinibacillus irui]MEA0976797.1 hypothetical protein [Lysinibacillus irui]MEA1042951.1 hypothetical protein [Lysinibacillus irui]